MIFCGLSQRQGAARDLFGPLRRADGLRRLGCNLKLNGVKIVEI
jgi:hypothetical protein